MPQEIMCPGRQCAPADNVPRKQFAPGDNMPRRQCAPEGNVPRKENPLWENMPWRKCAPEIMLPRDNVPWKTLLLFGPFWSGLAPFMYTSSMICGSTFEIKFFYVSTFFCMVLNRYNEYELHILQSSASTSTSTLAEVSFNPNFSSHPPTHRKSIFQ